MATTQQTEQTALDLPQEFGATGWRLLRFEMYNWGTFHEKVHELRVGCGNSVITGPNEAGKSTIIDGLTTLITPPAAVSYNMASGAEKRRERREDTYIRGVIGETLTAEGPKPIRLRMEETPTALLAVMQNVTTKEFFSFGRVCWIQNGEKAGFFIHAPRELSLKQDLADLKDTRTLESRLQKQGLNPGSHRQLETKLCQFFKFDPAALVLFGKVVSLRDTGDINAFIRENMLDALDVTDLLGEIFKQFEGIEQIHQTIARAEKQIQLLNPIADKHAVLVARRSDVAVTRKLTDAIPIFFPFEERRLGDKRKSELGDLQSAAVREEGYRTNEVEAARTILSQAEQARAKSAEAKQLESFDRQLDQLQQEMSSKQSASGRFIRALQEADMRISGPLTAQQFADIQARAAKQMVVVQGAADDAMRRLVDAGNREKALTTDINRIRQDIRELADRSGRLRGNLPQVRREICGALGIPEDRLPFACELMDVHETEELWRSSLEALLHGFGRSLVVPADLTSKVVSYLRKVTLPDLRLVFYSAQNTPIDRAALIPDDRDRVVSKLRFKPHHPLVGWLADHIRATFRHVCCRSEEQYEAEKYAMLPERVFKSGSRNEKDDRRAVLTKDQYILGWQNDSLRNDLRETVQRLLTEQSQIQEEVRKQQDIKNRNEARKLALNNLKQFSSFSDLDAVAVMPRIREVENQKRQLIASNDKLRLLEEAVQKGRDAVKAADINLKAATEARSAIDTQLLAVDNRIQAAISRSVLPPPGFDFDDVRAALQAFTKGMAWDFDSLGDIERDVSSKVRQKLENEEESVGVAAREARRAQQEFLNEFNEYSLTMGVEESHGAAFLALRDRLKREDLPRFQHQLREMTDRFNQGGLSTLQTDLRARVRADKEAIRNLNATLKDLGYAGYAGESYIRIEANETGGTIAKFKAELSECLGFTISNAPGSEAEREKAVQATRRLIEKLKTDDKYRRQVTDTRNWLTFVVRELDRNTDAEIMCYSTSGGRSGGGRAKLTYTILAASIAKQYGMLGKDPMNTFRLVLVDEMFGVTDETYSRYALDLFSRFGFQLICVTPLKSSARVVDGYADSFHLVTKPNGRTSIITSVTAEQIAREQARSETA